MTLNRLFSISLLTGLLSLSVPLAYAGSFSVMQYNPETGVFGMGAPALVTPRGYETIYQVYVVNYDTVPHTYEVHVVDQIVSVVDQTTGETDTSLSNVAAEQFEAGAWGKVAEPIELEAGEGKVVDVEFSIPETTALGTYSGGIVAFEVQDSTSAETSTGGGVTILSQIAFGFDFEVVEEPAPQDDDDKILEENRSPLLLGLSLGLVVAVLAIVGLRYHRAKPKKKTSRK